MILKRVQVKGVAAPATLPVESLHLMIFFPFRIIIRTQLDTRLAVRDIELGMASGVGPIAKIVKRQRPFCDKSFFVLVSPDAAKYR